MVYHVSVMPCYDKKLEASRPDFHSDEYDSRDVDCVISAGKRTKKNYQRCTPYPNKNVI